VRLVKFLVLDLSLEGSLRVHLGLPIIQEQLAVPLAHALVSFRVVVVNLLDLEVVLLLPLAQLAGNVLQPRRQLDLDVAPYLFVVPAVLLGLRCDTTLHELFEFHFTCAHQLIKIGISSQILTWVMS
jgi:hypothetical protein